MGKSQSYFSCHSCAWLLFSILHHIVKHPRLLYATIVRALWLVAKWALFLCNDWALFASCSRHIQRTFDGEDPCYGQLTAVKKGIPWLVSHNHITGSSVQLAEVIFFFKLCTHQLLIFIDRRLNYFRCLISIVLKRPYDKKLLNLIHSVITGNSQTPAYPYSWLISGMLFLTLRYKRIMSPISFFDELFLTCFTIFF